MAKINAVGNSSLAQQLEVVMVRDSDESFERHVTGKVGSLQLRMSERSVTWSPWNRMILLSNVSVKVVIHEEVRTIPESLTKVLQTSSQRPEFLAFVASGHAE